MTLEEAITYALQEEEASAWSSLCPLLRTSGKICSTTWAMTAMLSPCHLCTVMIDDTTADATEDATIKNSGQPWAKKSA